MPIHIAPEPVRAMPPQTPGTTSDTLKLVHLTGFGAMYFGDDLPQPPAARIRDGTNPRAQVRGRRSHRPRLLAASVFCGIVLALLG